MSPSMRFLLLLFLLSSLFLSSVSGGVVGVMYRADLPGIPQPKKVVPALIEAGITRVRLINGDASAIAAFIGSGIDINLSLEDAQLVAVFANDVGNAISWVNVTVAPTYPHAGITSISLGFGILTNFPEVSPVLITAMRNLNAALGNLSMTGVTVSTAHPFRIITTPFPPSAAEFNATVVPYMKPLLDYCAETGAPFLINIFPFDLYRSKAINGISTSFVMFEAWEDAYLVDSVTKLSYSNLYTAMVDSAVMALTKLNHSQMDVVAIGTGWPSDGNKVTEPEANRLFAAEYNERLISLLNMKVGTPLRPGYSPVTYIYALFDEPKVKEEDSYQNNWGIWRSDLSMKYALDFNPTITDNGGRDIMTKLSGFWMVASLLLVLIMLG